jgi:hypothetical protein
MEIREGLKEWLKIRHKMANFTNPNYRVSETLLCYSPPFASKIVAIPFPVFFGVEK